MNDDGRNPVSRDAALSIALLATPAALAATDLAQGAIVAMLSALLLLTFSVLQHMTKTIPARQTLFLLIGAAFATAADLLLQAFAWPQHQALQWWLPVIAIFSCAAHESRRRHRNDSHILRLWYIVGIAIAAPILIGALRTLGDLPLLGLPTVILLLAGLAIAVANRYLPPSNGNADRPKARRVRVTGTIG